MYYVNGALLVVIAVEKTVWTVSEDTVMPKFTRVDSKKRRKGSNPP